MRLVHISRKGLKESSKQARVMFTFTLYDRASKSSVRNVFLEKQLGKSSNMEKYKLTKKELWITFTLTFRNYHKFHLRVELDTSLPS